MQTTDTKWSKRPSWPFDSGELQINIKFPSFYWIDPLSLIVQANERHWIPETWEMVNKCIMSKKGFKRQQLQVQDTLYCAVVIKILISPLSFSVTDIFFLIHWIWQLLDIYLHDRLVLCKILFLPYCHAFGTQSEDKPARQSVNTTSTVNFFYDKNCLSIC